MYKAREILDGWWVEGHIEGVTGWAIDDHVINDEMDKLHAASLYSKLANKVLACFYNDRKRFIGIMRRAIAFNGSFFSSQRMVWQHLRNAYRPSLPDQYQSSVPRKISAATLK